MPTTLKDRNRPLLEEQFSAPPTDRLARAFDSYSAIDAGKRFFAAYDQWVGILSSQANRDEISSLTFATREDSQLFGEIRELGDRLDRSLLALLFDTKLGPVTRKYAVCKTVARSTGAAAEDRKEAGRG